MRPFPLLKLPREIIDIIICEITHPHDLVQLASTSSFFRDTIIPYHTEYRIIQLNITSSGQFDHVWAHLLKRPNLTRHIRRVAITEDYTQTLPGFSYAIVQAPSLRVSIHPKTLIQKEHNRPGVEDRRNVDELTFSALRLMTNLRSLTWKWVTKPPTPPFLRLLFNVSTEHLSLVMPMSCFGSIDPNAQPQFSVRCQPHSPIQSLRIEGPYWGMDPFLDPTLTWFNTLTSLRTLKIFPQLIHQCDKVHFPALRKLTVFAAPEQYPTLVAFLTRHSTLEALDWPWKGPLRLPSGILPNLKRLRCDFTFVKAMNKADIESGDLTSDRPIEQLSFQHPKWFQDEDLLFHKYICFDITNLDRLVLNKLKSVGSLKTIARSVPGIRELQFNRFYSEEPDTVELVNALQRFKNLEILRSPSIWSDFPKRSAAGGTTHRASSQLTKRVEELANASPRLRGVNHPWVADKQIVISRGWDGEVVVGLEDNRPNLM
ncbi:hypothetical protein BDN72DRAFT_882546 [Pluteus cervinus]|uniref:Uncharacterized protein n=1 Tax=Pluteus cervinus TaxID=181527 RepID=A0ACD3AAB9_9AGAR|nr:hypothetical protein BDN72DRAFT_882546 [Pluteus cervinus]